MDNPLQINLHDESIIQEEPLSKLKWNRLIVLCSPSRSKIAAGEQESRKILHRRAIDDLGFVMSMLQISFVYNSIR